MNIPVNKKTLLFFLVFLSVFSVALIFLVRNYTVLKFYKDIDYVTTQPKDEIIEKALTSIIDKKYGELNEDGISLVDYANIKTIDYVEDRFNLSPSQRDELIELYYKRKPVLIYQFNKHLNLKSDIEIESDNTPIVSIYKNLNSIKEHSALLASATCDLAFLGFRIAEKSSVSNEIAISGLCPAVMSSVVEPIVKILEEKAIIEDINSFIISSKSETEKSILELGTASNIKIFDVSVADGYKLLGFWKRESRINAKLQVITKVGFDLTNDDFVIYLDAQNHILNINLPEPKIVSQEKNLKFGQIDRDFFGPLGDNLTTEMQDKVDVYVSSIDIDETKNTAKLNAQSALINLYVPVLSLLDDRKYRIQVTYGRDKEFGEYKKIEYQDRKDGFFDKIIGFFD